MTDRDALIAAAADAQGRGDREAVREILEKLAGLDKPEKAVLKKQTETRRRGQPNDTRA